LAGSDPTERHLYRVRLDPKKGPPERLSREPGWHDAVWGVKPGVYVHTRLTLAGEYQSLVKKNDGMLIGEIGCLSEKPPFVPKLQIMEVQAAERTYKAALVRPRDFDPRRKYPVFVSVYAGPGHNQVIAATFPYLIEQWFADHGFVVVSLDGRGTQGRGREWERAIKGNFIDVALNDQVEGLKALGRMLPELDLDRVGIFGWSFGGYFSAMAVMLRPDVYHVGVAVAPVTDWLYYDTHYTERYLGLPGKFPEAYRKSSVLEVADRLTRPLLVIHGSSDDNVYFTHSLKLIETLFLAGKACDFLPLSGLTHLVPDPLVTRRLYTRIIDYVQANL